MTSICNEWAGAEQAEAAGGVGARRVGRVLDRTVQVVGQLLKHAANHLCVGRSWSGRW